MAWTNEGGGSHGGADWTISEATDVAGTHTLVGIFTIEDDVTLTITSDFSVECVDAYLSSAIVSDGYDVSIDSVREIRVDAIDSDGYVFLTSPFINYNNLSSPYTNTYSSMSGRVIYQENNSYLQRIRPDLVHTSEVSGILWALSEDSLQYSMDEGISWTNVGVPSEGDELSGLCATTSGKTYVGVRSKGLYRYTKNNGWELEYENVTMGIGRAGSYETIYVWCNPEDSLVAVGWNHVSNVDYVNFKIYKRSDSVWAISKSEGDVTRDALISNLNGHNNVIITCYYVTAVSGQPINNCWFENTVGWTRVVYSPGAWNGEGYDSPVHGFFQARCFEDSDGEVWVRVWISSATTYGTTLWDTVDETEVGEISELQTAYGSPKLFWQGNRKTNAWFLWDNNLGLPKLRKTPESSDATQLPSDVNLNNCALAVRDVSSTKIFVALPAGELHVYDYNNNSWTQLTNCTINSNNCLNLQWIKKE